MILYSFSSILYEGRQKEISRKTILRTINEFFLKSSVQLKITGFEPWTNSRANCAYQCWLISTCNIWFFVLL